jgi:protein tyrosine phosphatase (PTP) superfamily phosphohydrolase (DUF442 family)
MLLTCILVIVLVLVLFGAVVGCTPAAVITHGVPNLAVVEPGVWRSGQPTPEGWTYLYSLGVRHVVKLNMDSEGDDGPGELLGMSVHHIGIQPEGDKDIFDNVINTFVRPDPEMLSKALIVVKAGGGVLIHCTHGQDRTGLLVGMLRLQEGITKNKAYAEMLAHGFHPELHGLQEFWENLPK